MLKVERDTEILIDNQLKNLGWDNSPNSKDRNVYQQRVKTKKQKEQLQGERPDYVLYQSHSDIPIAIIEAKKVGCNIHEAIQQGIKYAKKIDCPIVFATDGVFTKTIQTKVNKPLKLNDEEIDELIRETLALQYINTNEFNSLNKKVIKSRGELISIFATANDYLRREGLKNGEERFTEFSNVLFLKLISEMEDIKDEIGNKKDESIIAKSFRWNYFKNKRGTELLSYVNDSVLKEFQLKYEDKNIFQLFLIQNPKTLELIVDELDGLQLTDINADIKGDAFEYFLKSYNAGNKDLGEYFTPRHLVKTLVKLLNPSIGEKIYDPFCGTGGMLIESFRHIKQSMPNSDNALSILKENTIYGNEITSTSRIAKMNMILIGDGHSNINRHDSLENPIDDLYDVVITNIPFSQSTEFNDFYDIPMSGKKNGNSICVQHCIRALKKNGRMGIIVPEGFLFDKKYKKTREYVCQKSNIQSIVSLPSGVFLPYTNVKTNILLLNDVKSGKEKSYYWYFTVKNDGYTLNNHRDKIEGENDLEIVISERNINEQSIEYLTKIGVKKVDIEKVKNDNYNFVGIRQEQAKKYKSKYPLQKIGDVVDLLRGPFGSSIKKSVCVKEGYKLYEQGNVIANDFTLGTYYIDEARFEMLKKFEIQKGDVLITCAGTLGRIAIVPDRFEKGIINSVLMRLRIKDKAMLSEYLSCLLESDVMQNEMVVQSMGTGIKNMRAGKELKSLFIPIPSIPEQKIIIGKINEKKKSIIDFNKKMNDLNIGIKKEVNMLFNS
mgnify:CR=1 FL=1